MIRLRWTLPVVLLAGCGTDPSAVLTIALDDVPQITQANTLTVSGTVSRSPETEEPVLVVAIAGGRTTVRDTLAPTGEFSLDIQLNQNQENQLAITASDMSGSVSEAVIAVIMHDNVGPRISSVVPFNRGAGISLTTPIEIVFEEPLTPGDASDGINLFHNSSPVAGSSVLSSDQLKLTFVPNETLHPNSVYEVRIDGFADEAGNPAGSGEEICFVTTFEGFPTDSAVDPVEDTQWTAGNPTGISRPDFRRARFTRDGVTLYAVFQFTNARTFGTTGENNTTMVIDIDIDQDASTGFQSIYDFLFADLEPESGMGAEVVIGVEPLASIGDSAYVGELISNDTEFFVRDAFLPGVCGPYYGFDTDYLFDTLADEGTFDLTVLTFADAEEGAHLDAGPETGHFTVDVSGGASPIVRHRTDQRISTSHVRTVRMRPWPPVRR